MRARACAVTIKIGSVSADLCDKQSIYHVISTVAYEYSGFSICVERLKLASSQLRNRNQVALIPLASTS